MILSLGTSVTVSPFLSWLAEDCFLQFIQEGLGRIILVGLCISKKEMVALFLFDWHFVLSCSAVSNFL